MPTDPPSTPPEPGASTPDPGASTPDPGAGRPAAPVSARVSIVVLTVLAVLLLLGSLLTWLGRDAVVDRFVAASPDTERSAVAQLVLIGLSRDAVLGLIAAVAAWSLGRRRAWARWVGLAVALFLGLLTVLSILQSGGATAYALLLVVLCAAAASSLLARTTKDWLPARSRT